jgi:hypothetical protein
LYKKLTIYNCLNIHIKAKGEGKGGEAMAPI